MTVNTHIGDTTRPAPQETLEGLEGEGGAAPLPTPDSGELLGAVQLDLEALAATVHHGKFTPAWIPLADLSPGSRYRLLEKMKKAGGRKIKLHWKTKKKRRRGWYWKNERRSKLARDRWLISTPEGLWFHYKRLATKKKRQWLIDKEAFAEVMHSVPEGGSLELWKYIFFIYRIDKNKDYTIDNIYIVDRYTKKELYRYIHTVQV